METPPTPPSPTSSTSTSTSTPSSHAVPPPPNTPATSVTSSDTAPTTSPTPLSSATSTHSDDEPPAAATVALSNTPSTPTSSTCTVPSAAPSFTHSRSATSSTLASSTVPAAIPRTNYLAELRERLSSTAARLADVTKRKDRFEGLMGRHLVAYQEANDSEKPMQQKAYEAVIREFNSLSKLAAQFAERMVLLEDEEMEILRSNFRRENEAGQTLTEVSATANPPSSIPHNARLEPNVPSPDNAGSSTAGSVGALACPVDAVDVLAPFYRRKNVGVEGGSGAGDCKYRGIGGRQNKKPQ
ncbi:hypothetical protein HDU96_010625 [Phlyctochytrium bullatum]|nr:hypothetical protein HDU96_010625 [Phlyctochytrium bullatum]